MPSSRGVTHRFGFQSKTKTPLPADAVTIPASARCAFHLPPAADFCFILQIRVLMSHCKSRSDSRTTLAMRDGSRYHTCGGCDEQHLPLPELDDRS